MELKGDANITAIWEYQPRINVEKKALAFLYQLTSYITISPKNVQNN